VAPGQRLARQEGQRLRKASQRRELPRLCPLLCRRRGTRGGVLRFGEQKLHRVHEPLLIVTSDAGVEVVEVHLRARDGVV
jgi:hypothetical protein